MTNEQIITQARLRLMNEGVIGTTGRTFSYTDAEGKVVEINEPEPIHTFAVWKGLGYTVKKGEHAVTALTIWKSVVKKGEEEETTKMILKKAHFFSPAQVQKA